MRYTPEQLVTFTQRADWANIEFIDRDKATIVTDPVSYGMFIALLALADPEFAQEIADTAYDLGPSILPGLPRQHFIEWAGIPTSDLKENA